MVLENKTKVVSSTGKAGKAFPRDNKVTEGMEVQTEETACTNILGSGRMAALVN